MTYQVFISYASADRAAADAVCEALEAAGQHCWLAPRNIAPGREWAEAIMEGIACCRVVVVLLSAASNASVQVRREVNVAVGSAKSIVPVRIEPVMPTGAMDYYLANTHWFDAFASQLDAYLDRLATTVAPLLQTPVPVVPDAAQYGTVMACAVTIDGTDEAAVARLAVARGTLLREVAQQGGWLAPGNGAEAIAQFPDAARALRCACHLAGRPIDGIGLRIGLHVGPVRRAGNGLAGPTAEAAAALCAAAAAGQILVSADLRAVYTLAEAEFIPYGDPIAAGEAGTLAVFRAIPIEAEAAAVANVLAPPSTSLIRGFGEHPAIAVLPFSTSGVAADQEYLADGLTEDLIGALSRWRSFPVLSRNSVFSLKGRTLDAREVGQRLGARYVLEGSLRKSGTNLRISVQMVDAETAQDLFSEKYDLAMEGLFTAQDDIVRALIGTLSPELLKHERMRAAAVERGTPGAYACLQRGLYHHYRYTREDNEAACALFRRALELEPDYASAHAALAISLVHAITSGWPEDPAAATEAAYGAAQQSVRLVPRDPQTHFALGIASMHKGFIAQAMACVQEAIRLNPSHAAALANLGFCHNYTMRPDQALETLERALRLSPNDPRRFMWLPAVSCAHYLAGRYHAAVLAARESLHANPRHIMIMRYLLAALGQMGRTAEAQAMLPMLRRLDPGPEVTEMLVRRFFVAPAADHIMDGLRKAGAA